MLNFRTCGRHKISISQGRFFEGDGFLFFLAQKSPHPPFPSCWSPHGRKWQRSAKTSSWISSSSVPTESSCPSRLCDEEVGLPKNDRLPKKRRVAIPPLHPPNPTFSPASPLPPLVFPQGCVGPNFFFEHRPMTRTGGGVGLLACFSVCQ